MNNDLKDAYFIRLKNDKEYFLHPDPTLETKEEVGYRICKGLKGAAGFKKENAENFIKLSGANNLEIVPAKEVLK